jgi:hypothetical protein
VDLEYNIAAISSEEELLRELAELLSAQWRNENCALIARINFTGRGELHHVLQKAQSLEQIQDYLNGQAEDVFVNRLQNLTQPDFDIEKKRKENSILGDYLRLCESVNSDLQLRGKVLLALSEVADHADVKNALDIHGGDEWLLEQLPKWLQQAESDGADLLLAEDHS